jgi:hypothetical protein
VVRATEDDPRSPPTSRHLTSPLTVLRELRRCRLAWRSPPTRSHGGSQGFKSPHLHPHNSPGHRPGGGHPPGRRRPGSPCRAANRQQPRTKRPPLLNRGHDEVVKRDRCTRPSDYDWGCSASIWMAPDGPGLLTLDASSVQTASDGYRRILWMIIGRIRRTRLGRKVRGVGCQLKGQPRLPAPGKHIARSRNQGSRFAELGFDRLTQDPCFGATR